MCACAVWPWPALQSWRRDKLLADHGGLSVPVRISSQTANEYDKALGSGFLANTTTLSAYLEEMRRAKGNAPLEAIT